VGPVCTPIPTPKWAPIPSRLPAAVEERFGADREPFDALAALAADHDVYLGCSCPTQKQPRVERCHTYLALQFMADRYPHLKVVLPSQG
jgi:hypothetical protein